MKERIKLTYLELVAMLLIAVVIGIFVWAVACLCF